MYEIIYKHGAQVYSNYGESRLLNSSFSMLQQSLIFLFNSTCQWKDHLLRHPISKTAHLTTLQLTASCRKYTSPQRQYRYHLTGSSAPETTSAPSSIRKTAWLGKASYQRYQQATKYLSTSTYAMKILTLKGQVTNLIKYHFCAQCCSIQKERREGSSLTRKREKSLGKINISEFKINTTPNAAQERTILCIKSGPPPILHNMYKNLKKIKTNREQKNINRLKSLPKSDIFMIPTPTASRDETIDLNSSVFPFPQIELKVLKNSESQHTKRICLNRRANMINQPLIILALEVFILLGSHICCQEGQRYC